MKKIFNLILAMVAIATISTSCSDEDANVTGKGKVSLSLSIDDKVTVLSRAVSDEELTSLQNTCKIYMYSSKGLIRKYHGTDEIPSEIWLVSGEYSAEAWAGDSVAASFDKKYYRGKTSFSVSPAKTAEARINCKIANVVASVAFDSSVDGVLSDYKVNIANTKGNLDFDKSKASSKGYFMMPAGDSKLTYTITGTKLDGNTYTQTGEINDVKAATEYAMTIKFDDKSFDSVGGSMFTVEVDENVVEINNSFELTAAPRITANFDLSQPKSGEAGGFKKLSIYASAVEELTSIELSGLNSIGFKAADAIQWMSMTEMTKQELTSFGVEIKAPFATEEYPNGDKRAAKITFTAELLNSLGNGSYSIGIKVGDNKGKIRTATLQLEISDDAVKAVQVADYDVWATSVTLSGSKAKEAATGIGIEYRKSGGQWTKVYAENTPFTIELSGLEGGVNYEYRAFADNDGEGNQFTSSTVYNFTTEVAAQLPNSGFETWSTDSDKAYIPAASDKDLFWDSGNHGSITMNINITTSESTIKNSGSYSAKLASNFPNLAGIGKFAAGNIFTGEYLATDGTDGVLGFGRTFSSRPKSLTAYVKYNPGQIDKTNSEAPECAKGANDKGHIYIALIDDHKETYNNKEYPLVIKTKKKERNLFNKNASYVIAYGEWTSTEATSSDNSMIKIEIPLEYKRKNVKPSAILVVCSASYWGDYFAGSTGSVMYIDDFTLNY